MLKFSNNWLLNFVNCAQYIIHLFLNIYLEYLCEKTLKLKKKHYFNNFDTSSIITKYIHSLCYVFVKSSCFCISFIGFSISCNFSTSDCGYTASPVSSLEWTRERSHTYRQGNNTFTISPGNLCKNPNWKLIIQLNFV